MSILKRLFGTQTAPGPDRGQRAEPDAAWYTVPSGGYFEVAGTSHHYAELARVFPPRPSDDDPLKVEVDAVVERERDNPYDPNAVAVRIHGRLAGYIPREHAPAWAAFLDRLEAEGYRARATARVWIGHSAYYVNLRADEDAAYQTPGEARVAREADEQRRREAAERRERAEKQALEAVRRAAGVCVTCGNAIERMPGRRGRPPIHCEACLVARKG